MVNYRNGQIYIIRSGQSEDIYIGSTTVGLSKRMAQHRSKYKRYTVGRDTYKSAFEVIKYGDAYIELVEDCPCNRKDELHRREGQIMRATENCVNMRIAGRTWKERYTDNKEVILAGRRIQYESIKDSRLRKLTCECGSVCSIGGHNQHTKTKKHQRYMANPLGRILL